MTISNSIPLQKSKTKPKWSSLGLSHEEFISLKIQYPSAVKIRPWRLNNGHVGAIQIQMIGYPNKTKYILIIDFREFPIEIPYAYVRTPFDDQIRHPNIYHNKNYELAPRLSLCAVCIGDYHNQFLSTGRDRRKRLRFYIHQLQAVLSNPNYSDTARRN